MAIAGNWIPSGNDAPRLNSQLRNLISQLTAAAANAQVLANAMAQMAPSSDVTTIEAYFGVPTGSGQALKDVVGGVNTDLQGSNIQGLLQRFA